jgi:hypothetical protein
MSDVETLQARVIELREQRAALEHERTKEDLERAVDDWLAVARWQAVGKSTLIIGGQAVGAYLYEVLAELALDDPSLSTRLVGKLEAAGYGLMSDRQRAAKFKQLDAAIQKAEQAAREAAETAAVAKVRERFAAPYAHGDDPAALEAEFAGEAA